MRMSVQESGERAGWVGRVLRLAKPNFEGGAPGFHSLSKRKRHSVRVASHRYSGVDQHGVRSHFHSFGRVAGCSQPRIDNHRHCGLLNDDADFALNLMLKDARYAAALAQSLGAPAGMIEGAAKAFARADAKGLGSKDIAAVVG